MEKHICVEYDNFVFHGILRLNTQHVMTSMNAVISKKPCTILLYPGKGDLPGFQSDYKPGKKQIPDKSQQQSQADQPGVVVWRGAIRCIAPIVSTRK